MADGKAGRTSTSRHPFAIAYDAVETGDVVDIRLFREWIRSSHGRRMWTWSQSLRQSSVSDGAPRLRAPDEPTNQTRREK